MDQLGNTICILRLAIGHAALQAASSRKEAEAGLRCGCRLRLALFVLTMVASLGVRLTAPEGTETGRPAGTPEENLDAIKTQGCSGMFNIRSCTHIALPNTFIRKMSARKMTLQGLD